MAAIGCGTVHNHLDGDPDLGIANGAKPAGAGRMSPKLWPPRDWRAFIALVASILGAVALTFFAVWLVWILWLGGWPETTAVQRLGILGRALILLLVGALAVLLSLGLAINRRSLKLGRDGFSAEGGDDEHRS